MTTLLVEYVNHYGDDLLVVNAARVSMAKWHTKFDSQRDTKLLNYLARHQHISPFFHPQATFRITAPIFVARQLMRSTIGFALSETSRRYVADDPRIYEPASWRYRPEAIKQGSGGDIVDPDLTELLGNLYQESIVNNKSVYNIMLAHNVAPEMARMVLPVAMDTSWIWTGSLHAYHRMCSLRLDTHAQTESTKIAEQIDRHMSELFPVSWQALRRYNPLRYLSKMDKLRSLNIQEVDQILDSDDWWHHDQDRCSGNSGNSQNARRCDD
jgi:thymidylate synthase (FAD)